MINVARFGLLLSKHALDGLAAGSSLLRTPRHTNMRGKIGLVERSTRELVGTAKLDNCVPVEGEENSKFLWSLTAIERFSPRKLEVVGGPMWTRIAIAAHEPTEAAIETDDELDPEDEPSLASLEASENTEAQEAVKPFTPPEAPSTSKVQPVEPQPGESDKLLGDPRIFEAAEKPPESFRYSPIHDFWRELVKAGPMTVDQFFDLLARIGWKRPSGKPLTRAIVRTDLVSMVKNGFAKVVEAA